jgi:hypothetical protein
MIDHAETVAHLMARLTAALPIPARVTPELATSLRAQIGTAVASKCAVTSIHYAGDEGGADSDEGGHLFQSDRGHRSNLMAAT